MALIGDPEIALLDEPTTGIDPAARRSIWDLISGYRESGHSILLTSHRLVRFSRGTLNLIILIFLFSMDECEALSTRLAIIVDGQLRCVGETTTLKSIFGMNYSVVLKTNIKATDEDRTKLQTAMVDIFGPSCVLMDQHLVGLWKIQ